MLRVMPRNWSDEPPADWAERHAHRIAAELRRVRTDKSMSAKQVSDRTIELGAPVSRTVIADLENGRRRYVSTSELLVLAQALNVHPIDLLFPDAGADEAEWLPGYRDVEIEVMPGLTTTKNGALQLFSGLLDEESLDRRLRKAEQFSEKIREAMQHLEGVSSSLSQLDPTLRELSPELPPLPQLETDNGGSDGG
jgi:transcriptional regulator with XRE-family HTH domain